MLQQRRLVHVHASRTNATPMPTRSGWNVRTPAPTPGVWHQGTRPAAAPVGAPPTNEPDEDRVGWQQRLLAWGHDHFPA
jgi:hypothetical protein